MKILFILEYYYPNIGGVETLFKQLTENLVKSGHTITVLTNRYDKTLKKEEVLNGVYIKRVSLYNRYLFTFFAVFPALRNAVKHDFIHTTSYNAGIPAFFAGLLTGKKVIITFHEVWGKLWFSLPFINIFSKCLHFIFEQFLLRLPFYRFIAVSEYTKARLIQSGINAKKVEMIYNGIAYKEFANVSVAKTFDVFTFCYFGRLGISKGLNLLIDAIKLLADNDLSFKVVLILPSQPKRFLQKIKGMIEKRNITNHITMLHNLTKSDLMQTVKSTDCTIVPSYSEGFGFTAVESAALDTPIISSTKGSLPEVVSGPHIFYDPNTYEELAEAMKMAAKGNWDKNSDKKFFHLEDSVKNYEELYGQLLV